MIHKKNRKHLACWSSYTPFMREEEGLVMQLNIWSIWILCQRLCLSKSNFCQAPKLQNSVAKKTGKCISHDFAPGYLATVMRCLASYTTCILMGHKLFWFFWGFAETKKDKRHAPCLVFRTEKNCAISHLLGFPVSIDMGGGAILDSFGIES